MSWKKNQATTTNGGWDSADDIPDNSIPPTKIIGGVSSGGGWDSVSDIPDNSIPASKLVGGGTAGNSYITGRKINCIGDSITNGTTHDANRWTLQLQNNYGCTVRNYGVNGSTIYDRGDGYSISTRYTTMDLDADVIIVWGGWNDIHQAQPLGAFTDATGTNTFYGRLHAIANGLQTMYIGKKIFFCTILDTFHSWTTVKNYNQAIREVSEYWAIPVIEMSRVGFSARNTDVKTALVPDNTHPNGAGNAIIADVIAKFINSH